MKLSLLSPVTGNKTLARALAPALARFFLKLISSRDTKILFLLLLLGLSGCGKTMFNDEMVSGICFIPTERLVASWPSPFPPLTTEERKEDWAQELQMGKAFAKELDLFRAITCFKRAGFLSPPYSRVQEIDF